MEIPIFLLITGVIILVFIVGFWKKSNLLSLTLIVPVILGIIGAVTDPSSPCSTSPNISIMLTVMGSFLLATFIASIAFILAGIYQWIKYPKDLAKRREATQRILVGGITTIILTVVVFILVNIIIQAMGFGNLACLYIPTLHQIEAR